MNHTAAEQWLTFYYSYARNTLSVAAAAARYYAVTQVSYARNEFRGNRLWLEQWAAANLTA